MKKILVATLLFFGLLIATRQVLATQFPVYELGNCRDYQECHLYCEIPQNQATCWSYKVYKMPGQVLADESPETQVAALGITFPVVELGNCANIAACKVFCADVANKDVCEAFAKKYKLANKESLVEKAKTELGCDSKDACKAFCENATNKDACEAFAKRYHLKGFGTNPTLERAKTVLGCASIDQCKAFCTKTENQAKCAAFAHDAGVKNPKVEALLQTAKEQLGCSTLAECSKLCQDPANHDKCQKVLSGVTEKLKATLPTGSCGSSDECRKACADHPDKCPGFPNPHVSPILVPFRGGNDSSTSSRLGKPTLNQLNRPPEHPLQSTTRPTASSTSGFTGTTQ
jgi:hypothetical protein